MRTSSPRDHVNLVFSGTVRPRRRPMIRKRAVYPASSESHLVQGRIVALQHRDGLPRRWREVRQLGQRRDLVVELVRDDHPTLWEAAKGDGAGDLARAPA